MTQQRAGLDYRNPAKICRHCGRAVRYVSNVGTGQASYFTHVVTNHKWCDELDVPTLSLAMPEGIPCRNCGKHIKDIKRWGMTEWTHVETDDRKCRPSDAFSGGAYPVDHCQQCDVIGEAHSHCPKCGVHNLRFWQDAWADNWACDAAGCDYTRRYSMGD